MAKLEQALRLATSGECPTPTLGDYIAPTLDSIRHAWHDALTAVANAYDAAAVGIWSRTRAALATGADLLADAGDAGGAATRIVPGALALPTRGT